MINKIFRKIYLTKKIPLKYARYVGVNVDEGTRFMGLEHGMFGTEPFLITIGKKCLITGDVKFVTHDGSVFC